MTNFETWILAYLLNSLWQIPLLYGAGWIAARLLRRAGPGEEHRVWVSVLLTQTLLPVFSMFPWDWVPALFTWGGGGQRTLRPDVAVVMGPGTGTGTLHLPAGLLAVIAIAYGAVIAGFAVRFMRRWRALSRLRQESTDLVLSGEAAIDWAQCVQSFGIRDVSLATLPRLFGPSTMGLTRKLVLLPEDMIARLPAADLHTVLAHEFAHMRRNDFFKNLMYELLSLPASYHPLFWLTQERIMESREMVCDRMAAQAAGPGEYARSLLRLASLLINGVAIRTPHAIGIFDANAFERRLMRLTEKQNEIRGTRRMAIVAACVVFGATTCGSLLAVSMRVDADAVSSDSNAPRTPGRVDVAPKVMADLVLHKVTPVYPDPAKKARIQGKVVLSAIIGKDGTVENLQVISGPRDLQQSALDAVRQWTYKPFLLNGEPVEVKTTVIVVYSLSK